MPFQPSSTKQHHLESIVELVEQPQKVSNDPAQKKRECVVVLAGPTCSGKTDISLMLAETMGGEIISADSMQVYRGMNIGTAKVTQEEREEVPHHLVDVRDVHETFNVVDYCNEATKCCQEIHARKKVPIVTGGTGFYIHSLIYGPPDGPPPDLALRASLEEEGRKAGMEVLYNRLEQLDSEYAESITVHDTHKIIRALEIIELSGKKVSRFPWKKKLKPKNYHFLCYFLYRPRTTLYQRIENRCLEMINNGLIEEVRELEKKGIRENSSASRAIGYRHALDYLKTPMEPADYENFVRLFQRDSRHYAKRQFTWFHGQEPLFRWLDLDLHDPETVIDIISCDYQAWDWQI